MIKWDDFDEASPNNRATCQVCKKPITKGQPRVGQISSWERSPWTKWRHLNCINIVQAEQAVEDALISLNQAYKVYTVRKIIEASNVLS